MKKLAIMAIACTLMASCGKCDAPILFPEKDFQTTVDGKEVSIYTLKGGDITMQVTNFGARVVSLWTPDKDGKYDDIVFGIIWHGFIIGIAVRKYVTAVAAHPVHRAALHLYPVS